MFDLYQRDGHGKQHIAEGEDLEEVIEKALEKSAGPPKREEELINWEAFDDG